MSIAKAVFGLGMVGVALLGGAATATAGTVDTHTVKAWHDVKKRTCPSTSCDNPYNFTLHAGETAQAYCWTHGESITYAGITNDVWVKIRIEDGIPEYVSAVYLAGDKYGNLPVSNVCPS